MNSQARLIRARGGVYQYNGTGTTNGIDINYRADKDHAPLSSNVLRALNNGDDIKEAPSSGITASPNISG